MFQDRSHISVLPDKPNLDQKSQRKNRQIFHNNLSLKKSCKKLAISFSLHADIESACFQPSLSTLHPHKFFIGKIVMQESW